MALPRKDNNYICEVLAQWGKMLDTGQELPFTSLFGGVDNFKNVLSRYTENRQEIYGSSGDEVHYMNCFEGKIHIHDEFM